MDRRLRRCAYASLLVLLPAAGWTDDRWEQSTYSTDDTVQTHNELVHGSIQRGHDLQGALDQDWMVLRSKQRHSYEARVSSGSTAWQYDGGGCTNCAEFERVDWYGALLTPGFPDGSTVSFPRTLVVRWIATDGGNEFLRAEGRDTLLAGDTYDVELFDTTYFMPRFNNSGSQVTILLVQNTTDVLVTGEVYFHNAAGTLLSTQPLSLPARGVLVLNSSTIPALVGQSGAVMIAQLGGYGALAGKGVALEPTTGFTFDTPLTPLPR
jgi:hypothetical protein